MNRVALAPASASEVAGLATALQVGWGSLTDAFKAFDMQGQGYLTLISFSNGLVRAGYSRARAEALFRALDQMSFGRLNLRTFLSAFGVEEGPAVEGPAVEAGGSRAVSRGSSPIGAGDRNSSLSTSRQSSRAKTAPSQVASRFPEMPGPAPRQLPGASRNMPSQFQPLVRDSLRASSYKSSSPREAQQQPAPQEKFMKPEDSPQKIEQYRAMDRPQASLQASPVVARRDDGVDASVVSASSYLDGQTRLEERVAALHTSLETMLEDRVMALAQGLRAEWTKLFADEQAKFSLRTAAMGQALVKECEGKLPVGVLQDARAEGRAAAQQEMQGLILCFSSSAMDGNVDVSERSVELRAGLARFEQRIVDRAVAEGQRQIKVLREEVTALHGRQDRLQQRIAEVEVGRGSESPSGQISNEGVTRSMSMLADDIKDLARSLRDEIDEFRRECRDAWLEEAKTRDEADAATRRSVDKQFQNLRGELAHELEFQRSALQSLIRSFEDPGASGSPETIKRMVSQPVYSTSPGSLPGTRLCLPSPPVGLAAAKQEDWSGAPSVEGSSKPTTSAETLRSRQEGMSDSGSDMSTPNGSRSGRNDWVNQELRRASKSRGEFLNNTEVLGMIEVLRKEVLHVRQSSNRASAKQLSPRRQEPLAGPIVEEGAGSS